MATKTVSLELDAYEKLRAAKRGSESFSAVVRRAVIPGRARSGAEIINYLKSEGPFFTDEELDAMEAAGDADQPPVSPWNEEPTESVQKA
ncbi:MAG: putative CopG family antitoxin [Pseudoalteromonas tetraodonis]|jgi:predicted CopG family antitoxin